MKSKNKTLKLNANLMLKALAGLLTTIWILALCFPIYLMLVASFSAGTSEFSESFNLGITVPLKYTVNVDYTNDEIGNISDDELFLQVNSMLWRMYNYKQSKMGMTEVVVSIDGKTMASYSLSKADYEINKPRMWTKNVLNHIDIERVVSVIKSDGYISKGNNSEDYKNGFKNRFTKEISEDFSKDEDILGTIKGCTAKKSYGCMFDNYKIAWAYPKSIGLKTGMIKPIFNTIFVAIMKIALNIFVSALAAYSMSKLLPRGLKYKIQMIILASSMVPATLMLIPKYQVIQSIGLNDSLWALIIPGCASLGSLMLFKGTFDAYPNGILEAASLDGASEFYKFFRIVLPAAKGIIGVQIFSIFGSVWNEYFWPSMVIRDENKYTVSLVLNYMMNIDSKGFDVLLAVGFIISIPTLLLYAFFQKFLTYGIDFSGVKE